MCTLRFLCVRRWGRSAAHLPGGTLAHSTPLRCPKQYKRGDAKRTTFSSKRLLNHFFDIPPQPHLSASIFVYTTAACQQCWHSTVSAQTNVDWLHFPAVLYLRLLVSFPSAKALQTTTTANSNTATESMDLNDVFILQTLPHLQGNACARRRR